MITQCKKDVGEYEQKLNKTDLRLFVAFLRENSGSAIGVNKSFKMICRLEKVTGPT